MRQYTVHFLDDKEFESLPYKDTQISLGLADSHTREAYVRRTGINALDLHTAMHELEHLEDGRHGEHAHHEHYGDGVYYKGFGEVLGMAAPVLGFIPGIGPLLSIGAGLGSSILGQRDQAKQQQAAMQQQQAAQYSQNPYVSQPQVSQPNISTPSSFGMGTEQKTDPNQKQSLWDTLNPKGKFAGR